MERINLLKRDISRFEKEAKKRNHDKLYVDYLIYRLEKMYITDEEDNMHLTIKSLIDSFSTKCKCIENGC